MSNLARSASCQLLFARPSRSDLETPLANLMVEVTWSEGPRASRTEKVDLAPLINSMKFYRPLRDDEALFQTVHIVDDGEVLAWGENDAIDMAATSVVRLAEDMMTANDFRAFLRFVNYTQNTAAAQLGYSRRQIGYYLKGDPIPRVCVLACQTLKLRYLLRQTQYVFASTRRSEPHLPGPTLQMTASSSRAFGPSPNAQIYSTSSGFNVQLQSTGAIYD